MFNRIVVGTDFSEGSRLALEAGRKWAEKWGVPLTVLHVIQPPASPHMLNNMVFGWQEQLKKQAGEDVAALVKDFPGVVAEVKMGHPAEVLAAEADANTLIIVGYAGHSGPDSHHFFGSTAVKVVKHAPGNVLVVRKV
nr:universal stress protein [uncultured Holophaga sp.]